MISRDAKERVGVNFIRLSALVILIILGFVIVVLVTKSSLILTTQPFQNLFSNIWNPSAENAKYGYMPFILGTAVVTLISMGIAVPISVLSAIYIAEYAPKKMRIGIKSFIDILAGVPSVVFGLCGFIVLVQLVRDYIAPSSPSRGFCIFTASIVLAIMVFPIMISMCTEAFLAISNGLRESSLALGTTKWQMIKKVLLRASFPGIVASVLLGFGRAFGETMAVLMVVGNIPTADIRLFGAASTLPTQIASKYGDLQASPTGESAILFSALLLFIIVALFNILARFMLLRIERRWRQ